MGWRATWLADEFRRAGLVVVELESWRTRGFDFPDTPAEEGVSLFHHTASGRNSGPAGGLRIVAYGRTGLPGPIANWLTARNGVIYVIAAGVSNNAGTGNARAAGLPGTTGNSNTLANEMENDGIGEPYPAVQRTAALISHAVVHRVMGWPASRGIAHHEWSTTGKIDPLVRTWGTMPAARIQLAGVIAGTAPQEDDEMDWTKKTPMGGDTKSMTNGDWAGVLVRGANSAGAAKTASEKAATNTAAVLLKLDQIMAAVREDDVVTISPESIAAMVNAITDGVVAGLDVEIDEDVIAALKASVAQDISGRILNG